MTPTETILFILLALGIFFLRTQRKNILGRAITLIASMLMIFHYSGKLLSVLEYNSFVNEKHEIKLNDNEINWTKSKRWNIKLMNRKYNNTIWLLDPYIDDRIKTLEPIK
mgnify:CR=1 FL=1